ncbi:cytochrome P450 [Nocardia sp. NPDC004604]|uniref:cytochrome P450 n=1 Tax=Nocardia sp. NPDC004604 TaxID=3157013 RepID=UPI0033B5BA71
MTADTELLRYPLDASPGGHPPALFAKLHREEPVSRVQLPHGGEGWLVTRYEDVRAVLTDSRFSRAAAIDREDVARVPPRPASRTILSMDPPEHTRLRRLLAGAFSSGRVRNMRPRIESIVATLLSEVVAAGPGVDLVQAFAFPLPVIVISEILGVPHQDRHRLFEFSAAMASTTPDSREKVAAASAGLATYLAQQIAQRRTNPTDDLLGALVAARDNEDRLSEPELINLIIVLLLAGHETTAGSITNFVYLLLTSAGQWTYLCDHPELVPGAVEELLRFSQLNAGNLFPHIATEDVVLSGTRIRAGDAVFADTQAANIDESVFSDPNALDLNRKHNPHITFGHGVHHCVGASLARTELQVALTAMLQHFPDLHLAVPVDEIPWKAGMVVRGPMALPIAW